MLCTFLEAEGERRRERRRRVLGPSATRKMRTEDKLEARYDRRPPCLALYFALIRDSRSRPRRSTTHIPAYIFLLTPIIHGTVYRTSTLKTRLLSLVTHFAYHWPVFPQIFVVTLRRRRPEVSESMGVEGMHHYSHSAS